MERNGGTAVEKNRKILITGAAGFIGSNLAFNILSEDKNAEVIGIDNMNDYYDISLKEFRLERLCRMDRFVFLKGDIADKTFLENIFREYQPDIVINLAAQAGVRYSITNPDSYIQSNIIGFYNILECCRHSYDGGLPGVKHLVYASSSSVYGANKKHAYSKLYGLPSTGLRFFTVYGPAGRPDMAYFGFTNKMVKGEKIQIFNYGDMYRDFTYIDDIVAGVRKVMEKVPEPNEEGVRYKIYNIGNQKPESLLRFVEILESCLMKAGVIDQPAEKEFLPMQPGDVYQTYADVEELKRDFGFQPSTPLETGLDRFAQFQILRGVPRFFLRSRLFRSAFFQ